MKRCRCYGSTFRRCYSPILLCFPCSTFLTEGECECPNESLHVTLTLGSLCLPQRNNVAFLLHDLQSNAVCCCCWYINLCQSLTLLPSQSLSVKEKRNVVPCGLKVLKFFLRMKWAMLLLLQGCQLWLDEMTKL